MEDYIAFTKENLQFIRNRITQLRLQRGISERELNLAIGKSVGYIQSVCNGSMRPALIPLLEIICYFDLTPQEFFDPDITNPSLWNQVKASLKQLAEDDLEAILSFTERIPKEKQHRDSFSKL